MCPTLPQMRKTFRQMRKTSSWGVAAAMGIGSSEEIEG